MQCKIDRALALFAGFVIVACGTLAFGQAPAGPVKVFVKDGKVVSAGAELAVDRTVGISIGHSGGFRWGLTLEGKRITCSPQGSIWLQARVDGVETFVGDQNFAVVGVVDVRSVMEAKKGGKKPPAHTASWTQGNLHFTQILEIVPGKPVGKVAPGAKRRMDTCLCRYIVENKGTTEKMVELRTGIDILVNNNDGALFAAPTIFPGKVLNGIMLEGKTLPDFVQVLEQPDANNPNFFGVLTTKFGGRVDGPSRVALTNLSAFGAWEVNVAPAGDSALAIYWAAKKLRAGEKREMVFAYGGGIASNPETDGNIAVGLSGSFEPGKKFTITAHVDDPSPSQSLTLQLPDGMKLLEGKEIQPVPEPGDTGSSIVVWKATVERLGEFDLKIRSSSGVTQIKSLRIVAAGK